jgi:hypothetical protein
MKILDLQDAAVKEFESIFIAVGWIDGFSIRGFPDKIAKQAAPIFYRLTTPPEASAHIIKKTGAITAANLHALYNLVAPTDMYSGDSRAIRRQVISCEFYYSNEFMFYKDSTNQFYHYLGDLLDAFVAAGWGIEEYAEAAAEATDGTGDYQYSKSYRFEKLF